MRDSWEVGLIVEPDLCPEAIHCATINGNALSISYPGKLAQLDLPPITIGSSLKLFYIDIEQAFLGGTYQIDLVICALCRRVSAVWQLQVMGQFICWSRLGVFDRIFAALAGEGPKAKRIMINSTHLEAHRMAATFF
jgi:hypothetical protein